MCTELFLALLYFITILIVNYFLYKLLIGYYAKIIYLLKINNIIKTFNKSKSPLFSTIYTYENPESRFSLKRFNNVAFNNDLFLIGNTYKYLANILENEKSLTTNSIYYLKLLENQYLSKSIQLK